MHFQYKPILMQKTVINQIKLDDNGFLFIYDRKGSAIFPALFGWKTIIIQPRNRLSKPSISKQLNGCRKHFWL